MRIFKSHHVGIIFRWFGSALFMAKLIMARFIYKMLFFDDYTPKDSFNDLSPNPEP